MDDRITIRVPKKLLKSIDGYCAASGKGRSEAIRFLLERGAKEVSTRYSWNDQRADWTRLRGASSMSFTSPWQVYRMISPELSSSKET